MIYFCSEMHLVILISNDSLDRREAIWLAPDVNAYLPYILDDISSNYLELLQTDTDLTRIKRIAYILQCLSNIKRYFTKSAGRVEDFVLEQHMDTKCISKNRYNVEDPSSTAGTLIFGESLISRGIYLYVSKIEFGQCISIIRRVARPLVTAGTDIDEEVKPVEEIKPVEEVKPTEEAAKPVEAAKLVEDIVSAVADDLSDL